jgi:hypothetical protein
MLMWEMETGNKVKTLVGDKFNPNLLDLNLIDFEVWTGKDPDEFYGPQVKRGVKCPSVYSQ